MTKHFTCVIVRYYLSFYTVLLKLHVDVRVYPRLLKSVHESQVDNEANGE